ncbi:MAG: heavy metal translocating P-type ATPase, partial [Isosphaeraceae bacterium]
ARRGILFQGGADLEEAAGLRAVALEKTGTLTIGKPRLVDLRPAEGVDPNDLLALAASAEAPSEHPLSRAVVKEAEARDLALAPATDVEAIVGRGLQARVNGRLIRVGKPDLIEEFSGEIPPALIECAATLAHEGKTVVFVGADQTVLGVLAIADALRSTADQAVKELRELGLEHVVMLTGDNARVAAAIAGPLQIEHAAGLLPEDKLRFIQELRKRYGSVAMVGDGINDAPALAAANLGVSVGVGGTDVALETADVVLMRDDLTLLPEAVALSRRANRVIRQNLVFAFGMMALLLASTYVGDLPLPLAVLGHEGSTVLVILNGVRLLRAPQRMDAESRAVIATSTP